MKFRPGDMLPTTVMEAVTGEAINLPDTKRLVHLQFRRFVDCPICNTHIAEFRRRARETEADVPFLMVGDPKKAIYKDFGVETSLGFMSLKALGAGMRGMAHGHFGLRLAGGPLGLPADFLIAPSGRINAVKYGTNAYDQWSVDELLTFAKGVAAEPVEGKHHVVT